MADLVVGLGELELVLGLGELELGAQAEQEEVEEELESLDNLCQNCSSCYDQCCIELHCRHSFHK